MTRKSQSRWIWVVLTLSALAVGIGFYGCGESGNSGAAELAKEEQIQAAREQAAQDARQSAKIAALEHRLKGANVRRQERASTPSVSPEVPVGAEEPLTGLWKGEAVIRYDSGESAPFNQAIDLKSLQIGGVSGYSVAHQGTTTCHGAITYEGASEGWYRFSAEERNVAECIDYSVVELRPDGSGALSYRETTEVSVSTGTLDRAR